MRPFLLVSTRPEDEAARAEYGCFLRSTGLAPEQLEHARLDMIGLPDIDVEAYSGIFVAGSPYGTTTPHERKTATQVRTEKELARILGDVTDADVPCLTTGFGTEVAALLAGGRVTTRWAEEPQMVDIMLTAEGRQDPLLAALPTEFSTYVGHHEAVEELPEGAVVLAKSLTCPVQMMRMGPHFWATQFNPEVDSDVIRLRLERWEDAGWSGTDDVDSLVLIGRSGPCRHQAGRLLATFVELHRSDERR